jgi:hypothetical protein
LTDAGYGDRDIDGLGDRLARGAHRRRRSRSPQHSDEGRCGVERLVAAFFDGWSALSMAAMMATCSLLASIAYCLLARPGERRIHWHAVKAPAVIEMTMHSWGCAIPRQNLGQAAD